MRKTLYLKKTQCFLLCFWLLWPLIVACQRAILPASPLAPTDIVVTTATPTLPAEELVTTLVVPPQHNDGNPTPLPPLTITPLAYLPEDIQPAFDRSLCDDYCWHGIVLGDSEADVLEKLRNDPAIDTAIDFQEDDFLYIQRSLEDGSVAIADWYMKDMPPDIDPRRGIAMGTVSFVNNKAAILAIPTEVFYFQVLLDILGEPSLISFADSGANFVIFSLIYPQKRVSFNVWVEGPPDAGTTLTGDSLVQKIIFTSYDIAQNNYCGVGYMHWAGLGDIKKYFSPANRNILITAESIPEWCNK
ncbi:MAG: hypothetical protein OT477_19310 [Chloroflexi bacterium]|nr:hypothetical protein [Chloroflexota bacterium]